MTTSAINIKRLRKGKDSLFAKIKCKCGSCRYDVEVAKDDDENYTWIQVRCKKCGNSLFYNGA